MVKDKYWFIKSIVYSHIQRWYILNTLHPTNEIATMGCSCMHKDHTLRYKKFIFKKPAIYRFMMNTIPYKAKTRSLSQVLLIGVIGQRLFTYTEVTWTCTCGDNWISRGDLDLKKSSETLAGCKRLLNGVVLRMRLFTPRSLVIAGMTP